MRKYLSLLAAALLSLSAFADSYKALEYIESTGGDRENAFTTDYLPSTPTVVKIGFQQTGSDGWMGIFCARDQWAGTGMSLYVNGTDDHGDKYLGFFVGNAAGENDRFATYEKGQRYDVEAHTTYLKYSVNGGSWENKETGKSAMVATSRKISLFANPEWDQQFKGKIFYATIEEDGNVIRDYKPVVRQDGVFGYYSKTGDKFMVPAKGSWNSYKPGYIEGETYLVGGYEPKTLLLGESTTIEDPEYVGPAPDVITYRTSDAGVATVDGRGNITAKGEGTCTIYVETTDKGMAWSLPVRIDVVDKSMTTYTEGAYIQRNSGRHQNPFTTDYTPNTNTSISVGFQQLGNNGWAAVFCARNGGAGTGISLYANGNNKNLGYFTGGTTGSGDDFLAYENGKRYDVVAHTSSLKWSIEGGDWQEKSTGNSTMNATTRKLSFFSNPEVDNAFIGKIFYATIKEGNDVVREYVPAMRHDGKFGFLDKKTNKFVVPAEGNWNDYEFGKKEGETYVTLSKTSTVLVESTSETIEVIGADGGNWISSDESVATVDNGVVTAVGVGKCVVTLIADSWKILLDVEVTPLTVDVAADAVSEWDGAADAILPAIRYAGNGAKWAYTWELSSGRGYNGDFFNHVFGAPEADEDGNEWYAKEYVLTNSPVDSWTYNNTVLPSNWSSNGIMGDVYVRRYFKAEGDLSDKTVYMPAPHDDSPCEYYINGVKVWGRTGYEPGVNGWYEDEVVRLTDEQKALIKTDGSVNVFAYHVHQNWGGLYADGGLYIAGKPAENFNNNGNRQLLEDNYNELMDAGFVMPELDYAGTCFNHLQDAAYANNKLVEAYYAAVKVNIGKSGYATFVARANFSLPEGLEAFAVQVAEQGGYVHLLPIEEIPVNEAVVLKGEEGEYSFEENIIDFADMDVENELIAEIEPKEADGEQYVLAQPEDGEVGFYPVAEGTVIPAYKGYLVVSEAPVKGFYPFGEGGATAIEGIASEETTGVIYNVAGQRVSKAVKGLYIVNGKKVLK